MQALQGGFGSAQAIPYLDFDLIAANPKPLVGYSGQDLHVAIRQRAGVATVYGNGLMGVGAVETTAFTKDRLLDVLRTGGAGEVPHDPDDPWVRTLHGGRVARTSRQWVPVALDADDGDAMGDGARRRDPVFRGHAHAAVLPRRSPGSARPCRQARAGRGCRRRADGEVGLGDLRPVSDWARSRTIEDVLEERLGSLGVPAIYGLPLGHTKHLAALPLGMTCTLDADAKTLTVDAPALR